MDFFLQRGFDLKESGTRFVTLCPFHDEKTPSFTVSPERGSYYCFGCGKSGDMFNYLEEKESIGFMDALEMMCDQLDIPFTVDEDDGSHASRKLMMRILADTWAFFKREYAALPENHPAKQQVASRGLDTDSDKHYGLLGWAPQNGRKLVEYLHGKGYSDDAMVEAGAVHRSKKTGGVYVMWRGRLMFPLRDLTGHVVGFSGRIIFKDDKLKGKYVNSPGSELFHKSEVLFCSDVARSKAREDHEVYVVEGQFDVLAMQMIGRTNTVASSGTAFTPQHAALLKRMVGENGRIVFCLDADNAGQNAELKIFKALGDSQSQAYAVVTSDKDPSDMYRDDPRELEKQIQNPIPLWEHIFNWTIQGKDLFKEQDRTEFRNEVRSIYASIVSPEMAESFARMASFRSGMPLETFTDNNKHGSDTAANNGNSVSNASTANTIVDPRVRDEQQDSASIIEKVKPHDDLDRVMDRLLCLALEDKTLRRELKPLPFRGVYRRGLQQLLIMDENRMIIPEDPIFDSPDIIMYVRWLDKLNNRLREYDYTAKGEFDSKRLFNQNVRIFHKVKNKMDMSKLMAMRSTALTGITGKLNPIDLRSLAQYAEQMEKTKAALAAANHVDK